MRLRFGDCVFDRKTRELHRGGTLVHLPPKVFSLLETLLAERPSALSKEKLAESLWPGTFVADGNIARLVAELREAIGDDALTPRFVRTVARYGYAFHGDAIEEHRHPSDRPAGAVSYTLIWGDREIALGEGPNVLGRDPGADVAVDDVSVSRHHARIVIDGFSARIEDLGSKNGTFLGDRRLEAAAPLRDGDSIRLGAVAMVFRRVESGTSTRTVSSR
jgi:DNA-binding winged helix-turn-helix (wHTH) protein